jgi:hypothetical protein
VAEVGYADLGPSLPVTPLVRDDGLRRGDPCAARLQQACDPLPIGFGIGWPLGGPSVAQGPPKRLARARLGSIRTKSLFATETRKMAAGWEEIAEIAKIV